MKLMPFRQIVAANRNDGLDRKIGPSETEKWRTDQNEYQFHRILYRLKLVILSTSLLYPASCNVLLQPPMRAPDDINGSNSSYDPCGKSNRPYCGSVARIQ